MKVCDVVMDSVWYDPRVRKQIQQYKGNDIDLSVVGIEDSRINYDEIQKLDCQLSIVPKRDVKFCKIKKINHLLTKISRILLLTRDVSNVIVETAPDIIHANDLDALLPSYLAAKKVGAKLIYDTHEIFLENVGIVSNPLLKLFWSIFERFVISKVDLVVFVSHSAAEYMSKKYHIKKSLVITNCCNRIDKDRITLPKNDFFQILNHGQFYEGRGYDVMVKAAQLTADDNIIYALRGFGKMEESLRAYVNKEQLTNVRFYPPVKVTELVSYASTAHVGVAITLPLCLNFELSVSNKIFEYAAAGLPVIMSNIPEHVYLNKKYKFGIILKTNTPEELRDAVMKLYQDKEMYKLLSSNALKMSSEINWESEFLKLLEFEKVMLS